MVPRRRTRYRADQPESLSTIYGEPLHLRKDTTLTDRTRARRSDAALNRQRILDAARDAFATGGEETSMAEVARRSGLGQATVYRNFATRQALLEALLVDEVEEVCASAATVEGDTPGARLEGWLRRFFRYVTDKRPVVLGLLMLEDTDTTNPVFQTRDRLLAAGAPLFAAAQASGEIRRELQLAQALDLVMAIAKIPGIPAYKGPILDTALVGLRTEG